MADKDAEKHCLSFLLPADVTKYFSELSDDQLKIDLEKAGYEFYKHINIQMFSDCVSTDKGNVHPDSVDENQEIKYSIKVGHSEYDQDKAQIVVALSLESEEVEKKESEQPYSIKIELVGLFKIDEGRFHREHVYDWARRNAPFILFPYLREHAYSLTIRCGYGIIVSDNYFPVFLSV